MKKRISLLLLIITLCLPFSVFALESNSVGNSNGGDGALSSVRPGTLAGNGFVGFRISFVDSNGNTLNGESYDFMFYSYSPSYISPTPSVVYYNSSKNNKSRFDAERYNASLTTEYSNANFLLEIPTYESLYNAINANGGQGQIHTTHASFDRNSQTFANIRTWFNNLTDRSDPSRAKINATALANAINGIYGVGDIDNVLLKISESSCDESKAVYIIAEILLLRNIGGSNKFYYGTLDETIGMPEVNGISISGMGYYDFTYENGVISSVYKGTPAIGPSYTTPLYSEMTEFYDINSVRFSGLAYIIDYVADASDSCTVQGCTIASTGEFKSYATSGCALKADGTPVDKVACDISLGCTSNDYCEIKSFNEFNYYNSVQVTPTTLNQSARYITYYSNYESTVNECSASYRGKNGNDDCEKIVCDYACSDDDNSEWKPGYYDKSRFSSYNDLINQLNSFKDTYCTIPKGIELYNQCCEDSTNSIVKDPELDEIFSTRFLNGSDKKDASTIYVDDVMPVNIGSNTTSNYELKNTALDSNEYCSIYCVKALYINMPGAITARTGMNFTFKTNTSEFIDENNIVVNNGTISTINNVATPAILTNKKCRVIIDYVKWYNDFYQKNNIEAINKLNEYNRAVTMQRMVNNLTKTASGCSYDRESGYYIDGRKVVWSTSGKSGTCHVYNNPGVYARDSYTAYDENFNPRTEYISYSELGISYGTQYYEGETTSVSDPTLPTGCMSEEEYNNHQTQYRSTHRGATDTTVRICSSYNVGDSYPSYGSLQNSINSMINLSAKETAAKTAIENVNTMFNKINQCHLNNLDSTNLQSMLLTKEPVKGALDESLTASASEPLKLTLTYSQRYLTDLNKYENVIQEVTNYTYKCQIVNARVITDENKLTSSDVGGLSNKKYANGTYIKDDRVIVQYAANGIRTLKYVKAINEFNTTGLSQAFSVDSYISYKCYWQENDNNKNYTLAGYGSSQYSETKVKEKNYSINNKQYTVHLASYTGKYQVKWGIQGLGEKFSNAVAAQAGKTSCSGGTMNSTATKSTEINAASKEELDLTCTIQVNEGTTKYGSCIIDTSITPNGRAIFTDNSTSGANTNCKEADKIVDSNYLLFGFKIINENNIFTESECVGKTDAECYALIGYGSNWLETEKGQQLKSDIETAGSTSSVYAPDKLTYSFKLNGSAMKEIRQINNQRLSTGGYSDFDMKCVCSGGTGYRNAQGENTVINETSCSKCTSNFIDTITSDSFASGSTWNRADEALGKVRENLLK